MNADGRTRLNQTPEWTALAKRRVRLADAAAACQVGDLAGQLDAVEPGQRLVQRRAQLRRERVVGDQEHDSPENISIRDRQALSSGA